jgi:hypothetical protein
MKSILILTANPRGTPHLRLPAEVRDIEAIPGIVVNTKGAVRPRDMQQAVLNHKPQIVHFSGHGAGESGLYFEDETGREKLVKTEALADFFRILSNYVKCVVLNACHSNFQAEAIARHVDYVIGMNSGIGDQAAMEFSFGFYNAIAADQPIPVAYEFGRNAIQLATIPEDLVPTLFLRDHGYSPNQSYPLTSNDSRATVIDNTPTRPEQPDDLQVTFDEFDDLVRFLRAKQWQAADQETARLLLQYADTDCHRLKVGDIENIPCSVLRKIDRSWLRYSNKRFGFSTQSEIWRQQFGGRVDVQTEQSLGSYLGWRESGEWKDYNSIFHLDPLSYGMLPCFFLSDCCWRSDSFLPSLLERLLFCQG